MVLRLSLVLLLCAGALALDSVNKDITLVNVDRTIDLASQLVKISTKLTLTNSGQGAVKSFHFTVDEDAVDKVVFIGATVGGNDKTYLRVTETKLDEPKNLPAWRIELKKALNPGSEQTVIVDVLLSKAVQLYPAEITQKEKQMVLFSGNHYIFLPYKVKSQTTKVTLASTSIESYSKLKPLSQTDKVITYGPYSNIAPFSVDALSVHYENNNPFLVVTRMERAIELSMWGNIAVEETLDVRHAGAKLKGSFSRYEFQRENSGVSAVKNFKTVLPASATDVYYRDDIGNISTSALRVMDEAVEIDIRPRFPLFGGWKTHYVLGYNVPSYEYLFSKNEDFALNMRLLDHIFDDMIVEDFSLKIILPEGAVVGKLTTPYPMKREADTKHFTYLDTDGRPVVNIRSVQELTEKHIQDFQLEFKYPKFSMYREPLLLIGAYFIFFLLAIVYVRLDFAITKDESSEVKMKAAVLCEKVVAHQEKRNQTHAAFEEAVLKYKSSKDVNAFQTASKKVANDHKIETQAISDLAAQLKAIAPDAAEKVSELQKFDRTLREQQAAQAVLAEKFVSGKVAKQPFLDQEGVLVRKMEECSDKMRGIVAHLRL